MEDLAQFDLRSGQITEIPLRWKEDALEKPVFPNITANGPQDIPLNKERFCSYFRVVLTIAGYSEKATIHDIRLNLGKVIEGKSRIGFILCNIYTYTSHSKTWFCTCLTDLCT